MDKFYIAVYFFLAECLTPDLATLCTKDIIKLRKLLRVRTVSKVIVMTILKYMQLIAADLLPQDGRDQAFF